MTKKIFIAFIALPFIVLNALIITQFPLPAQDYDYHREESPAVSWNGVTLFDARMLAMAGISSTASPGFSASINPALIAGGDNLVVSASLHYIRHEAFQYWGVNRGVYRDPSPQAMNNSHFSGLALVIPMKSLRLSAGWYTSDLLELPSLDYEGESWDYSIQSPGSENHFFAAAAVKLGTSVDVGVKLAYASGRRDVFVDEYWKLYPARIQQEERHRLSYFIPSLGLRWNFSPAWNVMAAVVKPIRGKAKRTIDRLFESNVERIQLLDQQSTDSLYRPTRFYLGTTFTPKKWLVAAEMVYILWSDYQYEFYSELLPREMRNTLVMALAMEYHWQGRKSDFFSRLGYRIDPQPVTSPHMTLQALTGGLGLRTGKISIDIGAAYYFGSHQGITQRHFLLNSTLYITLGG